MKGYLTDPYFSLTQMLNFSWQVRIFSSEIDQNVFLQEISVGIMSSMIILPPVILMVSLFRK